jgi:hypothetical protein
MATSAGIWQLGFDIYIIIELKNIVKRALCCAAVGLSERVQAARRRSWT